MNKKLLKIINTIKENKNEPLIIDIKVEHDLRNDLGFSSLDLAELTVRIESEFGVDVFEDGLINTIGELKGKISHG